MTSFTVELNENTNIGKTFIAFMDTFLKGKKGIHIIKNASPYKADFVNKIKKSEKNGSYITVNPKDVWGSLNLK